MCVVDSARMAPAHFWPRQYRQFASLTRRIVRRLRGVNQRCVTLPPLESPPQRGRVLLSYILDGVLVSREEDLPHSHVNFWETWAMARAFREESYTVDVIHWTRRAPLPRTDYDIFVDVRRNFDRHAAQLPATCLKIAHMDTAHWRVHNGNQLRRLDDLRRRRGIALAPFKMVEENNAAENADLITVLGNQFTMDTFAYAQKPIRRVRLSNAFDYPYPAERDIATACRNFLWFGSEGFIHKGLDLVLEAFAGLPAHRLTVCGPIEREPAFRKAFADLLYQTPNIRTLGWVDVAGADFLDLARQHIAMVYPSCSEGGGGCVITAMHAGLLPVVTREASVDVSPDCGVLLPDASVEALRAAVLELSSAPPGRLDTMARAAWTWAREHHSRERFQREYRDLVNSLADQPRKD